jgi:hypothetical protein
MKLINILKEIKIYSPIPKFETNAQLASYLKNNPKFREELVDKIVKDSGISPENPDWIPIIQQWKEGLEDENGIFLGTDWNDKDEIFLSSEFDDRLYISINDLDFNIITGQEVPYGPNIFKYEIE